MPDPVARSTELVAAVVARITSGLADGDATTVTDDDPIPLIEDADGSDPLTTRKVWVLDDSEGNAIQSHGTRRRTCWVRVLVAERFTGAGKPTKAWKDARVLWVQNYVTNRLGVFGFDFKARLLGTFWVDETTIVTKCDLVRLRTQGLFLSELLFSFQELTPAITGGG